jgi:hypothetical protein
MRLIAPLADRLLTLAVPKVTAAGCCSPDNGLVKCYCSGGKLYQKACHYECNCVYMCDGCIWHGSYC